MNELELEIEVPMKVTVRFDPVKGFAGNEHEPGYPDHIDDLEVISIKYDSSIMDYQDIPLNVTYLKPTVDNALNFAVMCAKTDEEWREACLESIEEDAVEREISRHEGRLDDPFVEESLGGAR